MRKPVIAANWKMYKTPKESLAFLAEFLPLVKDHTASEIAIFPTMSSLGYVIEATKGTNITAGAQTMHWLNEGPYTGQTSPTMLESIDCTSVLIGHSERRIYAHETDDMVNLKLKAALAHDLIPTLCVGETFDKRESGLTEAVLNWQVAVALNGVKSGLCGKLIIAYEPVWAIGTGSVATPQQANDAHAIIRAEVARHLGPHCADGLRILYGGSVKPDNVASLMAQPEIDGALVGGASLQPKSFAEIVHNATS
jgi:triosephosphate isomerase (TIM)|nr:triose-phosphate isomerase [Granulicella sp. L60]